MAIDLSEKSDMSGPQGSSHLAAAGVSLIPNPMPTLTHETRWTKSRLIACNRIELEILEIQACTDAGYW